MEKISQEELNVILDKHQIWLNDDRTGKKADLHNTDCSGLDFSNNDLSCICLEGSNLSKANLSNCNLEYANLKNANLTYTKGLITKKKYMKNNFEFDEERNGYIVYKTFGSIHESPDYWIIKENSIIEEDCNMNKKYDRGFGINCGTLEWVRDFNEDDNLPIWKLLIKEEWLKGVIIPYVTGGNIRCKKAQLLNIVK